MLVLFPEFLFDKKFNLSSTEGILLISFQMHQFHIISNRKVGKFSRVAEISKNFSGKVGVYKTLQCEYFQKMCS